MDTLLATLEQHIRQANKPLTESQLAKETPIRRVDLPPLIRQLRDRAAAFVWLPCRSPNPRYWHRPAEAVIREVAAEVAGTELLSRADFLERVRTRAWQPGKSPVPAVVKEMIDAGELSLAKKVGGTSQLIFDPRHPKPLLDAFRDALSRVGLDVTIEPRVDLPERIYQLLGQTARSPGMTVSIPKLRAMAGFTGISKERFDEAALQLYRNQRVFLEHHDYPSSLTTEERNELVFDGRSTYYVGISVRSTEHLASRAQSV